MGSNHNVTSRQTLYEDNLFRDAARVAARIEGENLLMENSMLDETGVSPGKQQEFRNRLEKELQNRKKREKRTSRMKILQRAAIIILVFSAAITVTLFSVDAFRVRLLNFFMDVKPEYTEFQLNEGNRNEDGTPFVNWKNAYVPTYVPDGYLVETSENHDEMKAALLINVDGKIIDYAQYSETSSFNYDTEGASVEDATVNGNAGKLIVKGNNYSIVWKHESWIFVVMTQINEEETLKIAESIKFIN